MSNTISIKGFKCFSGETFNINELTVLTGSNGTGKSSLIQALLLTRLAVEKNVPLDLNSDYSETGWRSLKTPLNLGYELSLGTATDIFNENEKNISNITIQLDNEIFEILLPDEKDENTSVKVSLKNESFDNKNVPFWRRKEFYYLFTERLGPRLSLPSNHTNFLHCGYKGEFTAQVLLKNNFLKIEKSRLFENSKSEFLPQQVDLWLNYICPGTSVRVETLGSMSAQIKLRNNSTKNHVLATNIGFGISYALPIIVNGLIALNDRVFIVENPEAHLHPKGQSNMGFFLAKIAASGVKVIVETHSEHIINGIRRSSISSLSPKPEDIQIYFFNGFDKDVNNISPITISSNGDLSDFPVDFFDQTRQDLLQILKLSKR